jgi:hypothetical protein
VRRRREPPIREHRILGEREGLARVAPNVLTHGQLVDLVLGDAVQDAARKLGALVAYFAR